MIGVEFHEALAPDRVEHALRQGALHQQADTVAHVGTDLVTGYGGQVELEPQQIDRLGQIGTRIDQGAVEIEEQSVNGHEETMVKGYRAVSCKL